MSGQGMNSLVEQILLGRPGVVSMLTLWCLAVGCVFIPLQHRRSPKYMLPGPVAGALLGLAQPSFLLDFALILLITAAAMGPATFLVSTDRQSTLRLCRLGDRSTGYPAVPAWKRRAIYLAGASSLVVSASRTPIAN